MLFRHTFFSIYIIWISFPVLSVADVVKPALVEISVYTTANVEIEVRTSLEALLTGINASYRNTQEAPTAQEYDDLRVLEVTALRERFKSFEASFLEKVQLFSNSGKVSLTITDIKIPEPGYTKVPRISTIILAAPLSRATKNLIWYYPESFGDNAVRVRQVDEANELWHWSEWQWLRNDQKSESFSLEELFLKTPIVEVVWSYIVLGFEHIVPKGLDHILFIVGIFLLSTSLKPLMWQITMFTVAHTITLGLSINGVIELSSRIVEPLIALSIAYIGMENIFAHSLHKSRLVLVFLFGLLHGLGFAGVLADFGMPREAFATALISFNVGVEFGQLFVVTLAWVGTAVWFKSKSVYRKFIVVPLSLMISFTGLYWMLDRLELLA